MFIKVILNTTVTNSQLFISGSNSKPPVINLHIKQNDTASKKKPIIASMGSQFSQIPKKIYIKIFNLLWLLASVIQL